MSRRAAVVEEFDDDTDLPLPSMPLPSTGSRGPILQEINDEDDEDDDLGTSYRAAGPASPSMQPPFSTSQHQSQHDPEAGKRVTDITPYKTWTCVYPIYLDAKRPYGQRRVARAKGLWWPLSKDIADAASRLGLGTLHEVSKAHPRDWENPGRVRVQWKKDGKLVNPVVKTKKQLLEMICYQLQMLKPENVPKPPYNLAKLPIPTPLSQKVPDSSQTPSSSSSGPTPSTDAQKGKASGGKHKSNHPPPPPTAKAENKDHRTKPIKRRTPIPPDPYPPLSSRLSAYSPMVASGMLIDTVKAGMSAQAEAATPGAGPNAVPGGMAKGKRKVVRVRQ